MSVIDIILSVLVGLIYAKWIALIVLLPFMAIDGHNRSRSTGLKLLSAPYLIVNRLTRGGWMRYALYQVGLLPSVGLRMWIYRCLGARIGKHAIVHFRTEIREPNHLTIGRGSIIGDNALLDARNGLTLGNNVNLSSNVSIYTLQHDHRDPEFGCYENQPEKKLSVEVDDRAWIGSNVTVLPGVHIGEGAICCAGCVVTKDVEPYAIVAGIPARKVGERTRDLTYELRERSCAFY